MARIYLSSTFQDLKDHREEVAKGLRRLRHEVIGMEDYVADGSRPLAKCLRDITGDPAQNLPPCDLYVGLFAKRYGYVPDEPANPDRWSITEAEYRTALRTLGAGPVTELAGTVERVVFPLPSGLRGSHAGKPPETGSAR